MSAVGDARVTTVVMTRNRREQLLRSVGRHDEPVVVVDNGSDDGSVEAVRDAYPWVNVIALDHNVGTVARNLGVEAAMTPYVAFADDDSWWHPGSLERAADLFDAYPRIGLLAACVMIQPGSRRDPFCDELAASPLPIEHEVPGVPILGFMACAVVVRREAFLAVGGFDAVLEFLGEEERVALGLADAGWSLQYVPELMVSHQPEVTGRAPRARARRAARNDVLTAMMCRPPGEVLRRVVRHVWSGRDGATGVLQAVPRLRGALVRRHVVGPDVEARKRLLETTLR